MMSRERGGSSTASDSPPCRNSITAGPASDKDAMAPAQPQTKSIFSSTNLLFVCYCSIEVDDSWILVLVITS